MLEGLSTELVGAAIYDLGRSALNSFTQREWVQRFLKKYDLKGAQHDFAARYLEALVELHLQQKPTEVLSFFREPSISRTFYHFYYGEETIRGNEAQVQQELAHWVVALKVGEELKNAHLDPLQEAQAFWQIFRQKVQESRTVKEVELEQQVRKLQNSLDQVNRQNSIPSPKFLTPLPFQAEIFLGREKDLYKIHDNLFNSKDKLLLLINGEGGIGKTSLASKYFDTYQDKYTYVAWVFKEKSIAESLMVLAIPLKVEFDEKWDIHQRLDVLIMAMASLPKPCLLVIDNANDLEDLRQFLPHLQRCSNFHILFTTRINYFPQLASYKIEPLTQDQALQVFKAHYPAFEPQEEALFYEIYASVQGNTLVLELLAKNLHNFNNKLKKNYLLADLRRDLEQGLLQLSKSSAVDIRYQAQGTGLRHEKIEVIIAAMYDLVDLSPAEIQMLSIFAVLPAESIPFESLEALSLGLDGLDFTLRVLAQKGWLDYNEAAAAFKCSPVIQEVVRVKNKNLLEDCRGLIDGLIDRLKYEGDIGYLLNSNYSEAILWARWATAVVGMPWSADNSIGILCECLGYYQRTTGNLAQALSFFEKQNRICQELNIVYPENVEFKNSLAISYSKLGEIHVVLGDLDLALTFFKQFNSLEKQLFSIFPANAEIKNGLAVSYCKLGDIYRDQRDLLQALTFFEQYKNLKEELYATYPQEVSSKYGLAISYSRLGDTYRELGDLISALAFFEKQNKLNEELFTAYPQNVAFKNGLAVSYSKLGSIHRDQGDLKMALTFFKRSNDLEKELTDNYPENVEFKNGLAISYSKLGQINRYLGNLNAALTCFEEQNRLYQELSIADSQNAAFKKGLAISYEKLGEIHRNLGNLIQALAFFEKQNKLAKELHEVFPLNVEFKLNLGWSYQFLGVVNNLLENQKSALKFFKNMALIFEELYGSYPENVEIKNGLAISFEKLGVTYLDLGNLNQAYSFLEKFNHSIRELYTACPENAFFKNGLAVSYLLLGEFFEQKKGNPEKAFEHYQCSLELLEELAAAFPDQLKFKQDLEKVKEKLKLKP